MHIAGRSADCPNCGGPIEIKLGSSGGLVCPYCRYSVARRDGEFVAWGKVGGLVPTSPVLRPGDTAEIDGKTLYVGGRVQVDQGQGPWDEYYVEASADGRWGYLAKAQGTYYLTFVTSADGLPSYDALAPGQSGELPGLPGVRFVVTERGESTLVSAEGELPFPIVSGERSRYADLSGEGDRFATIDFGDGQSAPTLYLGHAIPQARVKLTTAVAAVEKVKADKLACPSCGGPMPIRAPESCERAVCPHCRAVLAFEEDALKKIGQSSFEFDPLLPLGSEGTLEGDKYTIIGCMQRSVQDESGLYRWSEYLLYGEPGYRWLTEDGGHFVFFEPVHAANVTVGTHTAGYDERSYRAFQSSVGEVDGAIGEFYFRVKEGDRARLTDYIAPPYILSTEQSGDEILYSHGRYLRGAAVYRAFGLKGRPPRPTGVAPSQPNPHKMLAPAIIMVSLVALLCMLSSLAGRGQTHATLVEGPVNMPLYPGPPAEGGVLRTPEFTLHGRPTPLQFELNTSAMNQWVGASCALVDQSTGSARTFFLEAGYYQGRSGGESWSEGSQSADTYLSAVPGGSYVLEMLPQWQAFPQAGGNMPAGPPQASIRVTSGERSPMLTIFALLLLVAPFVITLGLHAAFEGRRKEGANL